MEKNDSHYIYPNGTKQSSPWKKSKKWNPSVISIPSLGSRGRKFLWCSIRIERARLARILKQCAYDLSPIPTKRQRPLLPSLPLGNWKLEIGTWFVCRKMLLRSIGRLWPYKSFPIQRQISTRARAPAPWTRISFTSYFMDAVHL